MSISYEYVFYTYSCYLLDLEYSKDYEYASFEDLGQV